MSEDHLIRNCAPTLAGIKTASLFTCPLESREELRQAVRRLNRWLCGKGLRLIPLRFSDTKALLYLYRPDRLRQDLSQETAACLLARQGYEPGCCEKCVVQLAKKLRSREDFPHEIGLFLGYPAEDVRGFMEKGPQCCKCSGCWKVYGDEEAAKQTFARYKHCTRVYRDQWARGRQLQQLTVASAK